MVLTTYLGNINVIREIIIENFIFEKLYPDI